MPHAVLAPALIVAKRAADCTGATRHPVPSAVQHDGAPEKSSPQPYSPAAATAMSRRPATALVVRGQQIATPPASRPQETRPAPLASALNAWFPLTTTGDRLNGPVPSPMVPQMPIPQQ